MSSPGAVPTRHEIDAEAGGALLTARLRAGSLILLLAMIAFFIADAMHVPSGLPILAGVKIVQLILLTLVFRMAGRERNVRRMQWCGAVGIGALYLTTVVSTAVRGDPLSTILVLLAVSMATATFVPWTAAVQLFTVICAGIATVGAMRVAPVPGVQWPGYLWIATATVLVGSVWISREHARR